MSISIFVGWIMIIASLAGFAWLVQRIRFYLSGTRTTGTIVEYKALHTSDSDGGWYYALYPVVEYTARGQKHRITASIPTANATRSNLVEKSAALETGLPASVIHDPTDPAKAHLLTFSNYWLAPLALAGLGPLYIFIAIINGVPAQTFLGG